MWSISEKTCGIKCSDPIDIDTWTATSLTNAPSKRYGHSAVWAGDSMIIWGGNAYGGSIYYPSSNLWRPVSNINQPISGKFNTANWFNDKMYTFGGSSNYLASYNNYTDLIFNNSFE